MKISVNPADVQGCGFYRMIAPATVLKKMGANLELNYQSNNILAHRKDGKITGLQYEPFDLLVFQRPMADDAVEVMRRLKQDGVKIIIDVDDDFWSVDVKNPFYLDMMKTVGPAYIDNFNACLKMADLVTVSTPALAKLIPNKNVEVLRNCIPAPYLDVEAEGNREMFEGRTVVGWSGNTATHIGDVERMGYSLRTAVRRHNAKFFVVGSEDASSIAGFDDDEAFYAPWVDLALYPKAVKNFDVGVVPLAITRFNHCKSYLKGLEYASLGIPFVASPTDEYKYLNSHGVGLIAKEKHDWIRQLNRLLTEDNSELIEAGLEYARENTYEKNAWRWAEVWNSVL